SIPGGSFLAARRVRRQASPCAFHRCDHSPSSWRPRTPEASAKTATPRHARRARAIALALRQHLKAQGARGSNRLDEAHAHGITQSVGFPAAVADQRVLVFMMAPVIVADGGGWHEAVGPCLGEPNEETRARATPDPSFQLS